MERETYASTNRASNLYFAIYFVTYICNSIKIQGPPIALFLHLYYRDHNALRAAGFPHLACYATNPSICTSNNTMPLCAQFGLAETAWWAPEIAFLGAFSKHAGR